VIADRCFTAEWIAEKRQVMPHCSDIALEKSIYALALLERLAGSGLRFMFKGGTCMLLHLAQLRRISVDVDIVCTDPLEQILRTLDRLAVPPRFIRWEEDERNPDRRPRRKHFRFYYHPLDAHNPEPFVLLDVVLEHVAHPFIEMKPVTASFVEAVDPPSVRVPTINGLLGDKLTAFAPETVGVKYKSNLAQQIIKQMFDVGVLVPLATELGHVGQAHEASFDAENGFRRNLFNRNQALDDSLRTAFRVSQLGLTGERAWSAVNRGILVAGIGAINPTLTHEEFSIEAARLPASRAALVAALLRSGGLSFAPYRYAPDRVAGLPRRLEGHYAVFNSLYETATEAFFNWHYVAALMRPLHEQGLFEL
jgi:hypothetical protein